MYFNMFGCDKWGDYGSDVSESTKDCVPEAFGATSPAFFVLCVASCRVQCSTVLGLVQYSAVAVRPVASHS
jgi:hypothetical protein